MTEKKLFNQATLQEHEDRSGRVRNRRLRKPEVGTLNLVKVQAGERPPSACRYLCSALAQGLLGHVWIYSPLTNTDDPFRSL